MAAQENKESIGFWRFVMYGINTIFGLTFLVFLGSVYRSVGNWIFLLAVFGSVIAFSVGYVYAHLSKNLHSKGALYSFTQKAFGFRTAFFFNWCQYIQAPAVAAGGILSMVLAFSNLSWYHTYLWLIVILASVLFIGLSVLLIFGVHSTKWLLVCLTFIALGTYVFYYASAFASPNFFHNLFDTKSKINFSFPQLITAFFTFFFALGGIESLAASSEELNDKKGTVIKGLVSVMIFSIVGYFLALIVILGVLGAPTLASSSSSFGNNPLNLMWQNLYGTAATIIIIIFAVVRILSESAANLSNGWLTARIVEPFAIDGFLPLWIAKRNKFYQLNRAIIIHVLVTTLYVAGMFVALLSFPDESGTIAAPFSIYSILAFIQYIGALAALLALMHRGILKMNWFMLIYYYIIFAIVTFLTGAYFYATADIAIANHDDSQWITFGAATFSILLGGFVYWLGSILKWHDKGWKTNHKLSFAPAKLDHVDPGYNKR